MVDCPLQIFCNSTAVMFLTALQHDLKFHEVQFTLFQFSFSCSKNCQSEVVPDKKTILVSSCSSFCYGELEFSWSLYLYDDINQLEPFNLSSLNQIPKDEFENMTSNPLDELNLAIKPDSLQAGKKYTVAFRATRPTGVYGECRTTVIVNSPPAGGKRNFPSFFVVCLCFYFVC